MSSGRTTRRGSTKVVSYTRNGKPFNYQSGSDIRVSRNIATALPVVALPGVGITGAAAVRAVHTRAFGAKVGTIQRVSVRTNSRTGAKKVKVTTIAAPRGVGIAKARQGRQQIIRKQIGSGGRSSNRYGFGSSRGHTRRNQARDSRGRFR